MGLNQKNKILDMTIKNNKSRAPFPSHGLLVWNLLEIMIITIEGGMVWLSPIWKVWVGFVPNIV